MALNEITVKEDLSNLEILSRIENMMQCIETPEMRKIKKRDVSEYSAKLGKEFPHLKGRYPQIFNMVMLYERTFDIEKMKMMLNVLDMKKSGQLTSQQADNTITFSQFDEYVKDKIDYEKERETFEQVRNKI